MTDPKIPVGECPEHGIISGDDVDYNFPAPSECNQCESQLERVGFAREEQIEAIQ